MRIVDNSEGFIEMMQLWDLQKGQWIPFKLWPRQKEYLYYLHNYSFVVFLKKRQVGGSQLTGADSLVQCLCLDNFTVLVLSKSGADAEEFLYRVVNMYNSLPESVKDASPLNKRPTISEMHWVNGSRMISLPANRGEGYTGDRVVIDEAARITKKDSHLTLDQLMMNIGPVIEKAKGQIVLVSKASGYNLFHNYYQKGKDPETSIRSFFFSCYDDPGFSKEQRLQIIKDFGEDHANENYPENDVQAFLMSGRCCFNRKMLQLFMNRDLRKGKHGYIERIDQRVFFKEDDEGWFEKFEDPIPSVSYVIGVDTAEGIEREGIMEDKQKSDFSAATVWKRDGDKLIQVARIKVRLNPKLFAEEIRRLGLYYNYAFLCVERNKDGLGVLLELKDTLRYTNLYYQESYDPDTETRKKKLGWYTEGKITKPAMIRTADALIRSDQVIFRSSLTLSEFMTFVRFADGKTGAQEGTHDDEAMGTMIAWECFSKAPKIGRKNKNRRGYKKAKVREDKFAQMSGY
jgi:hypothetical protein